MRPSRTLHALSASLAAALLLAPALVTAQDGQVVVRYVPIEDFGDVLFSNVDGVFEATLDPATGEVWYASGGGLVRINTTLAARKVYAVAEGLPTPLVHRLARDADGILWLASDAGLVRFDPATETAKFWNPAVDTKAPAYIVSLVAPDPDGTLWVGTRDRGLARFDPATESWIGRWNTSVGSNRPVLAASWSEDGVYFAARQAGVLRYDRDADTLLPILQPEPYAFETANTVLAAPDGTLWVGTDAGLWRKWPTNGTWQRYGGDVLSDVRVQDLDLREGAELWASTKTGVTVLNLTTGRFGYLGTGRGLIHNWVHNSHFEGPRWGLFATLKGLSVADFEKGELQNYVTGATNGPNSNSLLAGTVHQGRIWYSTTDGASAFDPATQEWLSLGVVDGLEPRSLPVYEVVSDKDRLWFATQKFVWMFNQTSREWISIHDDYGSNVYFHVEVDGDVLWLPEWDTGLLEYRWKDNVTRRYDFTNSGLFDWLVTDAVATPEAVWVSTYSGLYKLDKQTRLFTTVYTKNDGFPSHELKEMWREGRDLWIATRAEGLVRFNMETEKVTGYFNKSTGALPGHDIRGLVRDGAYLWLAMGPQGLVRFDVLRHEYRRWNMSDGMPEDHANDVVMKDDVLYVGTHAGLARFDTETLTFLPMHVADPAKWLADNPVPDGSDVARPLKLPPSVRITAPLAGAAVTGEVAISGEAAKPGGAIDRVEVAIGDGDWVVANGTTRWSFAWNATAVAPGDHPVRARAVSGNETSKEDVISLAVIAPPKTPLSVHHTPPEGSAFAGRPLRLVAEARGDEPLSLRAFFLAAGAADYKEARFERKGAFWLAEIPAAETKEGDFRYFLEARSGRLSRTLPEDKTEPFVLALRPAPAAAVGIEVPPLVEVEPGETTRFAVRVTNQGSEPGSYVVEATGLRASWVSLDPTPFALAPGDSADREATLAVPGLAFADETSLTFTVKAVSSVADPARATVPLRILPGAADPTPATPSVEVSGKPRGLFGLPGPGLALLLPALAALAVLAGRPRRPGGGSP